MVKKKIDLNEELDFLKKNHYDSEITRIAFEDYEKSYQKSINDGTGFVIDENINYEYFFKKTKKEEIKEMIFLNSVYSYKYGISVHDEERVVDQMYSCNCGQMTGVENLDYICPNCHTTVERMEPKKVGWLILKDFKILHPFLLYILSQDLSPIDKKIKRRKKDDKTSLKDKDLTSNLEQDTEEEEVVSTEEPITEDEDNQIFSDDEEEEEEEQPTKEEEPPKEEKKGRKKAKEKTNGKYTLLEALNERKLEYSWSDILDSNGDKFELFVNKYLRTKKDLIMMYRDLWYQEKIVVISKNYRPISIDEVEVVGVSHIDNHLLNTLYTNISGCVRDLNDHPYENPKSWIEDQLKSLCGYVAAIGNIIFSEIGNTKKSHIRAEIYGKKYTFSARLVLESIVDPNIHEIDICQIPVDYFRATFVEDIIKIGKEMKIPPVRLRNLMDVDYPITEEDRNLLKYEIFPRVKNPVVYTNREPDIYIPSITSLRVHSLIDDMVLRIPFFILPAINGDFDGDVLSVITWSTAEMRKRIFETLGIKKSIIDTFDVAYNESIGPNNNTAVLLYKGFNKPIKITKVT